MKCLYKARRMNVLVISILTVSLIFRWILKLFWWCSSFTIGSLASMLATTLCQFQIKSGHHLIRTADGLRWQLVYMGHKQSNIITMKFENYMIYDWKIAELVLKIITQSLAITNDSTTRLSTKSIERKPIVANGQRLLLQWGSCCAIFSFFFV